MNTTEGPRGLYWHAHPLRWWDRFSDQCNIEILPWRFLQPNVAKLLIPDNRLGESIFRGVMAFEKVFPRVATLLGAFPMIILTKLPVANNDAKK